MIKVAKTVIGRPVDFIRYECGYRKASAKAASRAEPSC